MTKAVSDTKDKLKALKDAQKSMDKNGVDKNSDQYRALQREIVDTQQEVKRLEKAAKQSNAVMSKVGQVAKEISDKTGEWAQKTKALSSAAAGGMAAIGGLAYKAATAADNLNTLAKQSGFSTEELQKMEYAADRMDVEVDTITGAARKLKKNMSSSSEDVAAAFSKIGVAVTDSAGQYRNSEDVFWETVAGLGAVTDETERDILAMTVFGKSADELAGLIDDGGKSFKDMGEEAEKLGLILSQETLDSLNETNDKIDQLKAQGAATFAKVGAKAAEVLLPIFGKVAGGIEKVLDWLGKLDEGQIETILKILAIVAAISPLLTIISKVSGAISALTTILPILSGIITTAKIAFGALNAVLAANPIILIITAIAALVAAFIYLWNNCDEFREFWIDLWEGIKTAFSAAVNWITEKFEAIKEVFTGKLENIKSAFESNGGGIKGVVAAMFTGIKELSTLEFDVLNALTGGKLGEIVSKFQAKGAELKQKVTDTIENVKQKFRDGLDKIKSFFSGLKLQLPKIKLPHFKISGDLSLNPPSVPHLSIDWYSKAMNRPMLLNSPTIFGAAGGKLLGGGEAGSEVVSGAATLLKMIESAVVKGMRAYTPVYAGGTTNNRNVTVTMNNNFKGSDKASAQEIVSEINRLLGNLY